MRTSRTTNIHERHHRAEKVRALSAALTSTFGQAQKLPELVETMEQTLWDALCARVLGNDKSGKPKTASPETRAELVTFLRASQTVETIAKSAPVQIVTVPRTVEQLYAFATSEGDTSLAAACSMVLNGSRDSAAVNYVNSVLKLRAFEAARAVAA